MKKHYNQDKQYVKTYFYYLDINNINKITSKLYNEQNFITNKKNVKFTTPPIQVI